MASKLKTLTKEDVIEIHNILTEDALSTSDPISPPGTKDVGLLESAIGRQYVGLGGVLKYDDSISNAASLCYGVCCNHAFYNGNKRTALVTLLCHLDKNDITFKNNVNQDRMFSLMLNIASHKLIKSKKKLKSNQSDLEVKEMTI